MIRSISLTQSGKSNNITVDQIADVLRNKGNFLWLDIVAEPAESCNSILHDIFNFHPLSIDDALYETHVPKVDDWDKYLYVVLRAVKTESQDTSVIFTQELDIFMGLNFLVTYSDESIAAIETIWELCHKDHRYLSKGASYLLYQIADKIVTNTMIMIEDMDDQIDQIEDKIFTDPQPIILEQIFSIKRGVLKLRRTLLPQKEVFNKLARGDFALLPEQDRAYFRDVYDHMVRLQEINESLRDLINGALDTYLSVINNRMNDVMKTLTIITTLFMPISFLTGFFGMNFFQAMIPLEIWTGKLAFVLVLAGVFFIPFGMYMWMRRRAWM